MCLKLRSMHALIFIQARDERSAAILEVEIYANCSSMMSLRYVVVLCRQAVDCHTEGWQWEGGSAESDSVRQQLPLQCSRLRHGEKQRQSARAEACPCLPCSHA